MWWMLLVLTYLDLLDFILYTIFNILNMVLNKKFWNSGSTKHMVSDMYTKNSETKIGHAGVVGL